MHEVHYLQMDMYLPEPTAGTLHANRQLSQKSGYVFMKTLADSLCYNEVDPGVEYY